VTINKLIWSLLGTAAIALQTAVADGGMSVQDWVVVSALLLASFGTWIVPNTPFLNTAKTWVNALVVGAGALEVVLVGGVTQAEGLTVLLAVLTSAGVYVIPNRVKTIEG